MKKSFNRGGLVLTLSAAFLLSLSCGKEAPVVAPSEPSAFIPPEPDPEPPSLSSDIESPLLGYPGDAGEVYFTSAGSGPLVVDIHAERLADVSCELDEDALSGLLRFVFSPEEDTRGSVTLILSSGSLSSELSFETKTYRFIVAAEPVILPCYKGARFPLAFSLDTDIPGCQLVLAPDDEAFFSVEGDCLVSLEENTEREARQSFLSVREASGKMRSFRIPVIQKGTPVSEEDCPVLFTDGAMKAAMVSLADTDGDGEVSFREALEIREIDIAGKGITDLTGLEAFRRVWKLDARDNDIEDATCLKDLPLLYWLDLGGNRSLRIFNVTGCTQYFEHCAFERSSSLTYYTFRQQAGVTSTSDPDCSCSCHVVDSRETTDWSHHGRMILVQKHTKTVNSQEFPWILQEEDYQFDGPGGYSEHFTQEGMAPSVVFSGEGYIDVDFEDGSWERLMRKAVTAFFRAYPKMEKYRDYFDIYLLAYVAPDRNRYCCGMKSDWNTDPQVLSAVNSILEDRDDMTRIAYESLYGDTADWTALSTILRWDSGGVGTTYAMCSSRWPLQMLVEVGNHPELTYPRVTDGKNYTWVNAHGQEAPWNSIDYRGYVNHLWFSLHGRMGANLSGDEQEAYYRKAYAPTVEDVFSDNPQAGCIIDSFLHNAGFLEYIE